MSKAMEYFARIGRHRLANQEGSVLVEMAFSSIALFAMFFGIFEFSTACYTSNYMSDAAREATRWAIVRGSTSCKNIAGLDHCNATSDDIANYAKNLGYPAIRKSNMTVTTSYYSPSATYPTTWSLCTTGTCNLPGNMVRVDVSYSFPLAIPFVTSKTLSLGSTSQMVISQ
jgi:Flp pilus assembly protein TadG